VHRIGRTARAGATGVAISFSCERFCFGLPDIEAYISRSVPLLPVEQEMLEIGKPTHPEATAEGLKREDRADPDGNARSGKSGGGGGGGRGRPARGQKPGGRPRR